MSGEKQPRPGQATLAGVLIIGGSIVVILAAWQRISTLHTLEAQEGLQRWLSSNDAGGLTVDGLATTIRVLCLIGAGAAAASTILGFQVFQRSASARIILTALSPLLLLGGMATAAFLAPMVLAGIALLWLQPTRDWYAGRPWVQRYEQRRADRMAALRSPSPTVPGPTDTADPADQTRPAPETPGPAGPPPPPPAGHSPFAQHRPGGVRRRPGALTAVCVLAWVMSTLTVVGLALTSLAVATQADELFAEMRRQQPDLVESSGMTERDLVASVYVVIGGLIVWSLVAIVLAGLAFAGQNWARIALAVSSVCAGLLAVVMALSAPPVVVLVPVFAVSAWLLLRPDVARWYQR